MKTKGQSCNAKECEIQLEIQSNRKTANATSPHFHLHVPGPGVTKLPPAPRLPRPVVLPKAVNAGLAERRPEGTVSAITTAITKKNENKHNKENNGIHVGAWRTIELVLQQQQRVQRFRGRQHQPRNGESTNYFK